MLYQTLFLALTVFIFSLLAALLFLTAPNIGVNVSWISARTHSLATTFFLLGTLLLALEKPRYYSSTVLFIISAASYESMAMFPAFLTIMLCIKIGEMYGYKSIFKMVDEFKPLFCMALILLIFLIYRSYVLSIYAVAVGQSADSMADISTNLLGIYGIMSAANKWMAPTLAFIFICTLYLKKYRSAMLLSLLGSVALISPFLLAGDSAPRYTYLLTGYLSSFICVICFHLFRNNMAVLMLIVVILLFGVGRGIKKNVEYTNDTKIASTMAVNILDKLADKLDPLPDNKEIFIAGIPAKYKRSWVHATYFDVALKKQMRQESSRATIYWDFRIMGSPADFKKASADDDFYLYENGDLQRVEIEEWKSSNQVQAMKL